MPLAVSVRFDFVDSKNKTSFTKVRVPNGFALTDYQAFAVAMAQLMTNISVCRITRASVCIGLDLSGATLRAVATGTSDIAQKAFFQFRSVVPGFFNRVKIPTLNETKVPVGSDAIDQADVDVAAFTAAMTSGLTVTGGTIQPTDDREQDLTAVAFARELFRKT